MLTTLLLAGLLLSALLLLAGLLLSALLATLLLAALLLLARFLVRILIHPVVLSNFDSKRHFDAHAPRQNIMRGPLYLFHFDHKSDIQRKMSCGTCDMRRVPETDNRMIDDETVSVAVASRSGFSAGHHWRIRSGAAHTASVRSRSASQKKRWLHARDCSAFRLGWT
ncbi:MAG TPA: hypothetical protein VKG24_11620 [Pseudolabrys sp.]|jgi:hypothetical protein|nr:hypothetical protein [Pseudolabrys sp.]